ncbi:MAG: exodeoxyribonuclease III [Pseudomonadota bacterium]
MKIASWNVNSIKQRLPHVKRWLEKTETDVLMIQELKGLDFPSEDIKAAGYESVFVNQKAFNGVAILSKEPVEVVLDALPGDESDEQARYLEVDYEDMRLINIYLPNGNPVDTEKYPYKLNWMERLSKRAKYLRDNNIPFLIGGDFNVIPADQDCYDPKSWEGDALFRPETHAAFRRLLNLGLTDAFRVFNHDIQYSYWDYQGGAWPQNKGIRIDHFLLSPPLVDKMSSCTIDSEPRGEEKASDHTPITVDLEEL